MQICATNRDNQDVRAAIFSQLEIGEHADSSRTDRQVWFVAELSSRPFPSFDTYLGMELSLVDQVEAVFVKSDSESGKGYSVITVINDRDPDVRARIYSREQAIMDEGRGIDFSFRVISRMNRDLSSLIDNVGKIVFKRQR